MSEVFTFDVSYFTTFSDLEKLREEMLAFVMAEKRHFQPVFDVSVQGTFKSNLSLRTCAAYTLSHPRPFTSHPAETPNCVLLLLLLTFYGFADFPEQKKMTLSADIKYKSNTQHAALRGGSFFGYYCFIYHTTYATNLRNS